MKILHVTDVFLPDLGGIEVIVNDLANAQRKAGHEVRVITATPAAPDAADASDASGAAGPYDDTIRVANAVFTPLRALIEREAPDVVHCHSSVVSPLGWRAARCAARLGLPVTVTMHSLVRERGGIALGLREVAAVMPESVRWNAVSTVAARALSGAIRKEVGVLTNGFDLSSCLPALPGVRPVPHVVSVMRLVRRKRPLQLISIFEQVQDHLGDVPWTATIAGDGPKRDAVEQAIEQAGLESRIRLTGRLGRPEILSLLSGADLYLAPATLESFGIAALEARCSGVPVIAMSSGGVNEFVTDGWDGRLVDGDAEMARWTARLIRDQRERARLAFHSLSRTPDMGWDATVVRTLETYRLAGVQVSRLRTAAGN